MNHAMTLSGCMNRARHRFRRTSGRSDKAESVCATGFALRLAQEGDRVRIVSLSGGRRYRKRLAGMGLRIGEEIEVLRNDMGGKLLLGHQGNRLFMGGGMAHKIQVAVIKGERK